MDERENKFALWYNKILDTDGRPNPFEENLPGRKWWDLFKKRHPNISLHQPMQLQLCRAQSCTSRVLAEWFRGFDQFLQMYSLLNYTPRLSTFSLFCALSLTL